MTTMLPAPFEGMEFRHNAWLEQDRKTPLLCCVTAVRKGTVYWKAVENGGVCGNSYCFDVESIAKYVKSVVLCK
jgi:hypothetical protein